MSRAATCFTTRIATLFNLIIPGWGVWRVATGHFEPFTLFALGWAVPVVLWYAWLRRFANRNAHPSQQQEGLAKLAQGVDWAAPAPQLNRARALPLAAQTIIATANGQVPGVPPDAFLRVLRYLGIAILVTAPVTAAIFWFEGEKATALALFGIKLYVGVFAAWGLPWLLRYFARPSQEGLAK